MTTSHAEREHALLSASGSHKWLHCTPSARLEEQFPETQSTYADEGRLAHEIAELKLRKHFIEPMGPRAFNNRLKKFKENPLFQEEMLRHTDTYLEYVQGIVHGFTAPPYIAIEKRLDYSAYAPEGFGTGDCIIIGGNTLHVCDLKYGKGVPVSAEGNPQMRLYALGAYVEYSFLYPIERVRMAIIQPRLDSISEDEISIAELLAWGESIKPIAQKAFAGEGEFVPGDHCRFCRARATCRARKEYYDPLEDFKRMKPPLISNEEVGQILERARGLAKWVSDLEKYALAECLKGNEIPGWKAVEGRGSRQYVDQDAAFAALKAAGIDEAVLYERKPLTVPAIEKVLGKAEYRKLLEEPGLVKVEPGKPTLAPISDNREAITRPSAADDFASWSDFNPQD
ncbi:DUF2800 domain-containing protein [Brevibacillus sp. LEMMJ03]|uniref:DUF2800 domain-containing protein n=1 Tax=Brevibacillus sp. LEMMJ03 TaxID=2595056 RepID=UPI00118113F0|nr:DUF2800 domain-containing protein [Brevibacillus sp. LEMMJ03]TRY23654.1 DUF2800 domain-containing protein [Brevibacillus sp. LEMMJ03]